jgi:hypothetical protein
MGSWGLTPFHTDNFRTTFDDVTQDVRSAVYGACRDALARAESDQDPWQEWTAIGVVIWAFHTGLLKRPERLECVGRALELWHRLERDPVWLEKWRNPRAFRKVFLSVRQELGDEASADYLPFLPYGLGEMFDEALPRRSRKR